MGQQPKPDGFPHGQARCAITAVAVLSVRPMRWPNPRIAPRHTGLADVAVYHLSMKSGSRNAGQSAAAHGAYIAREGKYAAQSLDDEAVSVEHGNLPVFAEGDAHRFWAAADAYERANGRLWTEIEVSLPRELSRDDQIALARAFREAMIGDRHAFLMAIHVPKTLDGQADNPHLHLMFCERTIDARTKLLDEDSYFKRNGALKDRSWNDQEKVEAVRLAWETMANRALERAGCDARIDRRSLAAQGITRAAEPKMGKAARDVGRFLRSVQSKAPVRIDQLSERAQAALSVRVVRTLDHERNAVVIELAKVREERAAKERLRAEQKQRLETLPLDQLRKETQTLKPADAALGRAAWQAQWQQLPEVVKADRHAQDALHAVGQAEGRLTSVAQQLEQVFQAAQAYKKAHRIKAALHAVGIKDATLNTFATEQTALAQRQTEGRQQLTMAEQQREAAEVQRQRTAADPMLQAQAREIHGDRLARWDDAREILARREAERVQADTLAEQLIAAQRLGEQFDRGRVPPAVREVLRYLDDGERIGSHERERRDTELVDALTRDPAMRQVVAKALAPQQPLIDREIQRVANQRERGGYER